MQPPTPAFADTHHRPATTAVLVTLFWIAAASVVTTAQTRLMPISPLAATAVTIGAIVLAAWSYTRLCARHSGVSHALGVGIAWFALAILAELVAASRLGHAWYGVLGSPDRPLLRTIFFFVWIFAPAMFAHRGEA